MGGEMKEERYWSRCYQNFASFPLCNHCSSLFENSVEGPRQARPDALVSFGTPKALWTGGLEEERPSSGNRKPTPQLRSPVAFRAIRASLIFLDHWVNQSANASGEV